MSELLPMQTQRGFFFWSLAPFLVAFLILMPALMPQRGPGPLVVLCGVEGAALMLLLGLWNSNRFWWAWRALGGIVFSAYLAYAVTMIVEGRFIGGGRRSDTNLVNALIGMVAFGLPGLCYALFGRLTWRSDQTEVDALMSGQAGDEEVEDDEAGEDFEEVEE